MQLGSKSEHKLSQSPLSRDLWFSWEDITAEISTPERGTEGQKNQQWAGRLWESGRLLRRTQLRPKGRLAGLAGRACCERGDVQRAHGQNQGLRKAWNRQHWRDGGRRGWGGRNIWVLHPETRGLRSIRTRDGGRDGT